MVKRGSIEDRRKYKRFPIELSARYVKENDRGWKGCTVTNISRGGIGIIVYLQEKISEGALLKLAIMFPKKEEPIKATGVVRWIKEQKGEKNFIGGVEFTEIDAEDKWKLLDYAYDNWKEEEEEEEEE